MGFHQIVDGLKEIELGGSSIGTTKKGIGPAYSSKASRSGLRVHHLYSPDFAEKFRKLVEGRFKRYGTFEYDTEAEIQKYLVSPCFRHWHTSIFGEPHPDRPKTFPGRNSPNVSARTSSTARPSCTKPSSRTNASSSKAPTPSCSTSITGLTLT
jgi:hypothetical protein